MTANDRMQQWLDKLTLAELLAALSAAVDRRDRAAIIACYAEDSHDDHGAFKGSGREFAEMICAPGGPGDRMTMHHLLGQSVFDVEGDDAWGETFFVMHAVVGGRTMSSFGRYVDYFRRIDESWRLVYRRVVPDATLPGDDANYWTATRDRSDPRYDRLKAPPQRP
jgi:ketosteroid isomerase-like protein